MSLKKEHFLVLPIIIILLTQELFWPFLFDNKSTGINSVYSDWAFWLSKLIAISSAIYAFYAVFKISIINRILLGSLLIYFIFLIFESIFYYSTPIKYPPVLVNISTTILSFSIFYFYLNKNIDLIITPIMYLVVGGVIMKIIIYPNILSPVSFIAHERAIPEFSVLMLLLPCLYFFNDSLVNRKLISLLIFILLLYLIFILNHRTVWVTTVGAFCINLYLLFSKKLVNTERLLRLVIPLFAIMLITISFALTYKPKLYERLDKDIDQILNPTTEGSTSAWRIEQMKSYLPFVKENLVFGTRLKGFELPQQFYHPGTDNIFFSTDLDFIHGHHFHSMYYDRLFYFGIIGVVLIATIMIRPFILVHKFKLSIDFKEIALLSFCTSGLIYGIAYDIPYHYWIYLGLTMSIIENKSYKLKNWFANEAKGLKNNFS